jgi:hypothetical protein
LVEVKKNKEQGTRCKAQEEKPKSKRQGPGTKTPIAKKQLAIGNGQLRTKELRTCFIKKQKPRLIARASYHQDK